MKLEKIKLPISTKLMYASAIVITLIGITFLINNIILFKDAVAYYVDQGVPFNEVLKQVIPQQLLPGVFEPIAVYGGIAFILFCTGKINQKITKCLNILDNSKNNSVDAIEQQEPKEEENEKSDAIEEITEETNEIQPSEN